MNAPTARRMLGLVVVTLFVSLAASPTTAAPVQSAAGKPTPSRTPHAPPGEYGSDTYYSTEQEEAELHAVADRAKSLHAVGGGRAGKDVMITQLSRAADVIPPAETIGSFTVIYRRSQFTAATLWATDAAIMSAVREHGKTSSTFGFFYDGLLDEIRVEGDIGDDLVKSLEPLAGVAVKVVVDESGGRLHAVR